MWGRRNKIGQMFDPDEVLLDSSNLPSFNTQQFEGRIERALPKRAILFLLCGFLFIGIGYLLRLGALQVVSGSEFRLRSEDNSLRVVIIPTERGVIYDRKGELVAWNNPTHGREYIDAPGLSHVLGYLSLPTEEDLAELDLADESLRVGRMGVERQYDRELRGVIGEKLQEVDSEGGVLSESLHKVPVDGDPLNLTIDADLSSALHEYISDVAQERDFAGGAAVIMDVRTGEVLALTSYPEFPLSLVSGTTTQQGLNDYLRDSRKPFLNRAISGLYAPGSVLKPFIAAGALNENIIDPGKQILSTGAMEVPNPYDPSNPSIFKDWKAHGLIDMRRALAVSSNVYFYQVGGGYRNQKGLGIQKINDYSFMFGFGAETGIDLPGELAGVVPSPTWKKEVFDEDWRLGDTYHTSIGQYGFQVTSLQMARATAALGNGGILRTPHVVRGRATEPKILPLSAKDLKVIREGMRLAVTDAGGTARALNVPYVKVAAKTGTAELGETRQRVNSWVEGYFPYENPRFAFAVVMESGRVGNTIGAAYVARQFLEWLNIYAPEYLAIEGESVI